MTPEEKTAADAAAAAAAQTQTKEMTRTELGTLIQGIVKDSTATEIAALKSKIEDVDRKAIFPNQSDPFGLGQVETKNGAVLDTSFFAKSYRGMLTPFGADKGKILAKELCNMGGPWLRLSPEMETFAKMIQCKFDTNAMAQAGLGSKEIHDYNDRVRACWKASGMSEGVAADGGVLVPVEYVATVVEFAVAQSPLLRMVWRLPMSSNSLKIPKLSQAAGSYFGAITLHWIDEAAHKTGTTPTLEQLTFTAYKLIGMLYLTDELISDSMINIMNYMTGLFTKAFQYEMERVILAGSGVGQPLGVINDPSINLVGRDAVSTVGFDDLVDMDSSIDENFRNLTWVTRKATLGTLRKLKDTNNQPIFHADYATFMGQPTTPPSLLGYPVVTTRNVPAMGSQGDVVLGDFGMYILAMRQDMRIDTSIHLKFDYDETAVRFVARLDGKPGVSIAFAVLNDATS